MGKAQRVILLAFMVICVLVHKSTQQGFFNRPWSSRVSPFQIETLFPPHDSCNPSPCSSVQRCELTTTSPYFKCTCSPDHQPINGSCLPIHPCMERPCPWHMSCKQWMDPNHSSLVNNYKCKCRWSGRRCLKINENSACYENQCHRFARCHPTWTGGYSCVCQLGFYGNGRYCTAKAYSCRNRCGKLYLGKGVQYLEQVDRKCRCDVDCARDNSCCRDYNLFCGV